MGPQRKCKAWMRGFLFVGILAMTGIPYAQAVQAPSSGAAIVSPTRPKDSRGEIVYEKQGESQKDQPIIPGVLTEPTLVHAPQPRYPKSLKKARSAGDVEITVVVAADGTAIDPIVVASPGTDATASALDSLKKYRFKPATLDGKPVASIIKIVIKFRIN
jgi:TonB family protein